AMTAIPTRVTAAAAAALPNPPGRLSAQALNAPGLEVRWYRPPNPDPQTPHDRDEVYIVVTGSGAFVRGAERVDFGPGDLLFAAKGETHRFENHTPDTALWVVFGPGA
ncbi:MAG: cupin domain-containing protein, partial [Tagaea sp.]|nr:cupin domain-containing protein [Tagaea sp.]